VKALLRRCIYWVGQHAARSYIAGPDVQDAIEICRQAAGYGWSSTICPWDGAEDTPDGVARSYETALESVGRGRLDCYLSIKVPSLGYNPGLLKSLLTSAGRHGIRVHFDAQEPETASPTFAMIEEARSYYDNLGCTLPSRWRRSVADVETAIRMNIPVRVVKGQWPDPGAPDRDPCEGYLQVIDALAGRARKVSVATHDISLARESLGRLKNAGTPCELEQLYGLPLRIETVSRPLDVDVRIYVPYGNAYLMYAIEEVRKKPVILYWLMKDAILRNRKSQKLKLRK
jgi:proline dehydrogenase